jgi:periplasmic divalent cation tolerance protein
MFAANDMTLPPVSTVPSVNVASLAPEEPSAGSVPGYCVVLVTAASEAEATTIAQALVQQKLAACVSLTPITSIYTWQNQLHQEPEWQLLIKTQLEYYPALEQIVQQLHSYEVPEIIALPIVAGSPSYLQWIAAQVSGS